MLLERTKDVVVAQYRVPHAVGGDGTGVLSPAPEKRQNCPVVLSSMVVLCRRPVCVSNLG